MGWVRDELRKASERAQQLPRYARPTVTRRPLRTQPQHKVNQQQRRPLEENEVLDWIEIASKREPPRKRDKLTLQSYLKAKSPRRWAALQYHLRWAERELLKLGMNPEDTRWVI